MNHVPTKLTANSQFSIFNFPFSIKKISHVVTTDNRQAVECEAWSPCIHNHDDIKSAEGTTEVFFCRTYGALIYRKHHFAGIPHFVLHTCLLSVAPTEL